MSKFRGFTVAAALAVAVACGGDADRTPDEQREGAGGAYGVGDNRQPTPAERASGVSPSGAEMMLSAEDQQFVRKAATGNRMEIEVANLAADKASHEQVKELAEQIEDDHEKADRELQSLVANTRGGSDVARASERTMPDQDQLRQRLEKMSGAEFDRAYLEEMVTHHEKDIKEFERAAKSSNAQIRAFAERTLPTLREHLESARQLQTTIR